MIDLTKDCTKPMFSAVACDKLSFNKRASIAQDIQFIKCYIGNVLSQHGALTFSEVRSLLCKEIVAFLEHLDTLERSEDLSGLDFGHKNLLVTDKVLQSIRTNCTLPVLTVLQDSVQHATPAELSAPRLLDSHYNIPASRRELPSWTEPDLPHNEPEHLGHLNPIDEMEYVLLGNEPSNCLYSLAGSEQLFSLELSEPYFPIQDHLDDADSCLAHQESETSAKAFDIGSKNEIAYDILTPPILASASLITKDCTSGTRASEQHQIAESAVRSELTLPRRGFPEATPSLTANAAAVRDNGSPSDPADASLNVRDSSCDPSRAPVCISKAETVAAALQQRLGEGQSDKIELLTRAFFAIGSPDALKQLNEAITHAKEASLSCLVADLSVPKNVLRALDELDSYSARTYILRRYLLVKLLDCRRECEQLYEQPRNLSGGSRSHSGRVELVRQSKVPHNGEIHSVALMPTHTIGRFKRSDSRAVSHLMELIYPNLDQPPLAGQHQAQCAYNRKRLKLKSRLACARNWHKMKTALTPGILALVPCGGEFMISIERLEKLNARTFSAFLAYLLEQRGAFLRRISHALSEDVFEVLAGRKVDVQYDFKRDDFWLEV